MPHAVWVLHGPNLNMLGVREPSHYGKATLADINLALIGWGESHQTVVTPYQSNHEGALVDRIQAARESADFILINPGAYTHTSVAIRDALSASELPFIEVHLSNIYSREPFRHHSYLSDIALGTVAGLGARGYRLALEHAIEHLSGQPWPPAPATTVAHGDT